MSNIICEAVLLAIPPQVVGLKFPALFELRLKPEQLDHLSQLLIDKHITVNVLGEAGDGFVISSSEFIDQKIKDLF